MNTPVILSYGLGVDSTAILLRWLHEPSSRDFDLADLTVVTAMTGDEWEGSGTLVEDHMLPLFRKHGVRFVQVARRSLLKQGDWVNVLDDSTAPTTLHLRGDFKLSDELLAGGTVAQKSGARLCSQKAKGEPLDVIIERLVGGKHAPFRHVMGYEANEPDRAAKDTLVGSKTLTGRVGEYPLIEWGWDRAKCEEYILAVTGVAWLKSACSFCPFAFGVRDGSRARTMARYRTEPEAAAQALFVEHVSMRFNERQSILGDVSLIELITQDGNQAALDALQARIAATPHALYRVRRLGQLRADGNLNWLRGVERISEPELLSFDVADVDGFTQVLRTREQPTASDKYVAAEEFYMLAPAMVADKHNRYTQAEYDELWAEAVGRV